MSRTWTSSSTHSGSKGAGTDGGSWYGHDYGDDGYGRRRPRPSRSRYIEPLVAHITRYDGARVALVHSASGYGTEIRTTNARGHVESTFSGPFRIGFYGSAAS